MFLGGTTGPDAHSSDSQRTSVRTERSRTPPHTSADGRRLTGCSTCSSTFLPRRSDHKDTVPHTWTPGHRVKGTDTFPLRERSSGHASTRSPHCPHVPGVPAPTFKGVPAGCAGLPGAGGKRVPRAVLMFLLASTSPGSLQTASDLQARQMLGPGPRGIGDTDARAPLPFPGLRFWSMKTLSSPLASIRPACRDNNTMRWRQGRAAGQGRGVTRHDRLRHPRENDCFCL